MEKMIPEERIRAKIKELEERLEHMKYLDGDRSYAEVELFEKNLKFFKEQIEGL